MRCLASLSSPFLLHPRQPLEDHLNGLQRQRLGEFVGGWSRHSIHGMGEHVQSGARRQLGGHGEREVRGGEWPRPVPVRRAQWGSCGEPPYPSSTDTPVHSEPVPLVVGPAAARNAFLRKAELYKGKTMAKVRQIRPFLYRSHAALERGP